MSQSERFPVCSLFFILVLSCSYWYKKHISAVVFLWLWALVPVACELKCTVPVVGSGHALFGKFVFLTSPSVVRVTVPSFWNIISAWWGTDVLCKLFLTLVPKRLPCSPMKLSGLGWELIPMEQACNCSLHQSYSRVEAWATCPLRTQ